MKIEILAVGSELLTPFFLDTNSLFLTRHLNDLGLRVAFKTVVSDDPADLQSSFRTGLDRSELVFAIGGLGPTQDDRTREALASVLDRSLVFHEALWNRIRERFDALGIRIAEVNRRQAFLIDGAEALENPHGTAPGQWLETEGRTIVLLPGPPREMEPMALTHVLPRLREQRRGFLVRRSLRIAGLSESRTEELISDLYPRTPNLDLTVLSSPGQIEIHCSAFSAHSESQARSEVEDLAAALSSRLGRHVFSTSEEDLEAVVGRLLKERGETLAVAESCTGGLIGHRITNVPGSSSYFLEGVQVYSNQAKMRLLKVPAVILERHGAVSSQTAAFMAECLRVEAGTDYALAVTGISGPGGGTKEKPVGLVYISLAAVGGTSTEKNLFLGDRATIKMRSSQKALDMLRLRLLDSPSRPV
jgi:nicotinamide-nucleotide amidase